MPLGPIQAPGASASATAAGFIAAFAAIGTNASDIGALETVNDAVGDVVNLATVGSPIKGNPSSPAGAVAALARATAAIAPSLGVNYTGDYMVVGADGTFGGVTCPTFSGSSFSVRSLLKPVSCSADTAYSEYLTCISSDPAYDRWESAVWWTGGTPHRFFEWIEVGQTVERVDNLTALGMVPNVWQEVLDRLIFNSGGVGVRQAYRRVYESSQSELTFDSAYWALVSEQPLSSSTSLLADNDTLPWTIGANSPDSVLHVARVKAYDGSTAVLNCDAANASNSTTIPDSVQTGQDWTATGTAAVV